MAAQTPPDATKPRFAVAPEYWLGLSNANEAYAAFASSEDILKTLFAHPILMLPEFAAAIEAQGRALDDSATEEAFEHLARSLREKQELIRKAPDAYAVLADHCGRKLGNDDQGDPRINLSFAAERFAEAAANFADQQAMADALFNEAVARSQLAQLCVDERGNLEKVIQLVRRAGTVFAAGTKADECARHEGWATERLAGLGPEPSAAAGSDASLNAYWLRLARITGVMDAFAAANGDEDMKKVLIEHPMILLPELPLALEAEADGANDPQVAQQSRRLGLEVAKAQLRLSDNKDAYNLSMIGCANELAYNKIGEPHMNLRRALELFGEIRALRLEGAIGARGTISEAIVHQLLAALGVDIRTNLDDALRLSRTAAEFYGQDYEVCRNVDAAVRRQLAYQSRHPPPSG